MCGRRTPGYVQASPAALACSRLSDTGEDPGGGGYSLIWAI